MSNIGMKFVSYNLVILFFFFFFFASLLTTFMGKMSHCCLLEGTTAKERETLYKRLTSKLFKHEKYKDNECLQRFIPLHLPGKHYSGT